MLDIIECQICLINLERLLQESRSNLAVTSVPCNRARRLKTAARRSHVTRKIPARKLYRVTLICGDHEINSGSIAAITPHAVGQRRKRRTGDSSGARGSPEVLFLEEAIGGKRKGGAAGDPCCCRGRRRRSRKNGRRKTERSTAGVVAHRH